eukprot:6343952-Amphidinium_carterae.1
MSERHIGQQHLSLRQICPADFPLEMGRLLAVAIALSIYLPIVFVGFVLLLISAMASSIGAVCSIPFSLHHQAV